MDASKSAYLSKSPISDIRLNIVNLGLIFIVLIRLFLNKLRLMPRSFGVYFAPAVLRRLMIFSGEDTLISEGRVYFIKSYKEDTITLHTATALP